MKKVFTVIATIALVICTAFSLIACGGTPPPENPPVEPPGTQEPGAVEITGVSFAPVTAIYDGAAKIVTAQGIPTGVTAEYVNNTRTNVGTTTATVTLSGDGYITKTLTTTITITPATMSGINFSGSTENTYNGNKFSLTLNSGAIPQGSTTVITYNNQEVDGVINAGTYTVKAVITNPNYNEYVITEQLVINPASMESLVTFTGKTVEYDTQIHSVAVVGNIPAGSVVEYTYNGIEVDGVSEVGSHTVIVTITNPNYITYSKSVVLKITSKEEQLYSVGRNGTVYFQNNLDSNKLYSYKNGTLKKVNNDIPNYMFNDGNDIYYYSSSLFNKSIKKLSTLDTASSVANISGEYLTSDGTYLYYAVNNLLLNSNENGIYKIKIDGSETEPTKICTEKAEYLTYYNNKIYYSNASQGGKLYSVATNGVNATGTLLWDEKVSYIINDGATLYFNSSTLTAAAIRKFNTTNSTCIKLTTDKGSYLTKIGDYIYYVNNDLLTSTLFGKGINKALATLSIDNHAPGNPIISADDNGYSSLSTDGENLYFYKLNDKHFYCYDIENETETDLMKNYVVPEETATLNGYARITAYNGEIYYTNIREDGVLYKYNPTTKLKVKVTTDTVSNINFYGGYMYYSTYLLGNYALFRTNLTTNETFKISSNRCENLIFSGEYVYYVNVGGAYNNYIEKMQIVEGMSVDNADNKPVITQLFKDKSLWVADMQLSGDYIYFTINPMLGKKMLYRYSISQNVGVSLEQEALTFTVNGDKIYFYDNNSSLCSCNLDGTGKSVLATGVEVNDMIVKDGVLYYSSTKSGKVGIYSYNLSTTASSTISATNGDAFTVVNGEIYFVQTAIKYVTDKATQVGASANNGYIYKISNGNIVKVA